jgi:hypothetical protein
MEDRDLAARLRRLTQDQLDKISRAERDREHRTSRYERDRMREFIRELYEELLSLAVAARSLLHRPPAPADSGDRPTTKSVERGKK